MQNKHDMQNSSLHGVAFPAVGVLPSLHDEITANKVAEAGFELSNFNWENHFLGLIDRHSKPTLGSMLGLLKTARFF